MEVADEGLGAIVHVLLRGLEEGIAKVRGQVTAASTTATLPQASQPGSLGSAINESLTNQDLGSNDDGSSSCSGGSDHDS